MPCEYMVVMPKLFPPNRPFRCWEAMTYRTPFSMIVPYGPSPGTCPADRKAMTHRAVMAGSRGPAPNPPPRPEVHDPSLLCESARYFRALSIATSNASRFGGSARAGIASTARARMALREGSSMPRFSLCFPPCQAHRSGGGDLAALRSPPPINTIRSHRLDSLPLGQLLEIQLDVSGVVLAVAGLHFLDDLRFDLAG